MALVFWLTFGVIGSFLSDLMGTGVDFVTQTVTSALVSSGANPVIISLVSDGILAGVGSVLSFLPTIITLFLFLSLLEDSGYMARVACVMDKLLRKIGLSGKSFVPMLIGFGCSVPAILSTRTLTSERDRRMTIFLVPFMSCSAKLPIYAMFTMAFFPKQAALVMIILYVTGMALGILTGLVLNKTAYKGNPVPFVMELPNYRLPSPKTVVLLLWDKTKDFLQRAFTLIFAASLVIWFLNTFGPGLNTVTNSGDSMLAGIGKLIAPVFSPLGFGDWRFYGADYGPCRQGSGYQFSGCSDRFRQRQCGTCDCPGGDVYAALRLFVPDLYTPLHALHRRDRSVQE
jgi:ferrous iron transport protein B